MANTHLPAKKRKYSLSEALECQPIPSCPCNGRLEDYATMSRMAGPVAVLVIVAHIQMRTLKGKVESGYL